MPPIKAREKKSKEAQGGELYLQKPRSPEAEDL